jgi:5-methylcytosine-specific restriction endonuclease McrA
VTTTFKGVRFELCTEPVVEGEVVSASSTRAKVCARCKKPKPFDDFGNLSRSKDGKHCYCKLCISELNAKWRRVYGAAYYQKNRRKSLDNAKRYESRYSQKRVANATRYNKAHPTEYKLAVKKCRHRRRAQIVATQIEPIDWRVVWTRDKGVCGICGKKVSFAKMSLDHIIPLSKGGPHTYNNVQASHLPCNVRKGAKVG